MVVVHDQFPTLNLPRTTVSVLQFRDFSDRKDLFKSTAALKRTDPTLTGQGEALRIRGMEATSKLFLLLGVRPELGRDFTSQDDTYGSAPVVLLSRGLGSESLGAIEPWSVESYGLTQRVTRLSASCRRKLKLCIPRRSPLADSGRWQGAEHAASFLLELNWYKMEEFRSQLDSAIQ